MRTKNMDKMRKPSIGIACFTYSFYSAIEMIINIALEGYIKEHYSIYLNIISFKVFFAFEYLFYSYLPW